MRRAFWSGKSNSDLTFSTQGLAIGILLSGTLNSSIVGHIPHDISRYIWYAMYASWHQKVRSDKGKPYLANGGHEIIINVEVDWKDMETLAILAKQVEQVNYPLYSDYRDNPKEISW